MSRLTLNLMPDLLAVCKLPPGAALPVDLLDRPFAAAVRTRDELSLVVPENAIPAGAEAEPGWRAFQVVGPLDFALTGILASLALPLAEAGISIFAVSTYDTDYVLVRAARVEQAAAVLQNSGFDVRLN